MIYFNLNYLLFQRQLAEKIKLLSSVKNDISQGRTQEDIQAKYPIFQPKEIESLMKFILGHAKCTKYELVEEFLKTI